MPRSQPEVFRAPESLGYELEPAEVAQARVGERLERALARAMQAGSFVRVQIGCKKLYPRESVLDQLVVFLERVTVIIMIRDIDTAWLILARVLEFEERAPQAARLNNSHLIEAA